MIGSLLLSRALVNAYILSYCSTRDLGLVGGRAQWDAEVPKHDKSHSAFQATAKLLSALDHGRNIPIMSTKYLISHKLLVS